jgi:zinc protease
MRVEDQPESRLQERFNAIAYDVNPYRRPVIGWQKDIESYQLSELQTWYNQWYSPNNATLVVVGDVQPEAVFAVAKEKFASLPSRQMGTNKSSQSLLPVGEKRLIVHDEKAKIQSLIMGYAVPSWKTSEDKQEVYALEVLAHILDGGSSARLSKELVRGSQLLTQADAGYELYARLSTQFTLSAVTVEGVSLEQAEAAMKATVAKLVKEGVTDAELKRVFAQVESSYIFEQDSMFYQGMKLGEASTVGIPLAEIDAYLERLRSVTAEQVRAAAQKWLVDDRLTVAYLLPKSTVIEQGAAR